MWLQDLTHGAKGDAGPERGQHRILQKLKASHHWQPRYIRDCEEVLPVVLLALVSQRALGTTLMLGTAWVCLVAFSCLATHATVGTAISSIERTGTWKMEVRGNTKAELATVEQQLAAMSRPTPPRPAKTVQEALAAERVPPSVWQDSQECGRIQDRAHFARDCAQIVQLRKELAAARDYERLSLRATELRQGVAEAPIISTPIRCRRHSVPPWAGYCRSAARKASLFC